MSVRCLIIKYATHKGLFVLSAQFGAVQKRGVFQFRKRQAANITGYAQVRRVLACQPCNCYLLPVNGFPLSLLFPVGTGVLDCPRKQRTKAKSWIGG